MGMTKVKAFTRPDRVVLESLQDAGVWSGSTDVANIETSTNHREGANSISFDKTGTTQSFAQIEKTLDANHPRNIVDFLGGQLKFWVNLSSLTNISNVQLIIGEDASDNYVYQVADSELSTGWNHVTFDINSPSSANGAGASWSSINYIAVKVNFDASANTLNDILVDAISVVQPARTEMLGKVVDITSMPSLTAGNVAPVYVDESGRTIVSLGTLIAGEDLSNNVMRVENRYDAVVCTADTQVKSSSGYVKGIVISATGTITAGELTLYDNTAESGTQKWHGEVQGDIDPIYIELNTVCDTGIYMGFDASIANAVATVIYR